MIARVRRRPRQLEHNEQSIVVRYLRAAGILFCSVPNGARTSMSAARRLKAEGMVRGAPDLLIFDAPPASPQSRGVAIEMKARDGAKPTPEQLEWQTSLAMRGWTTIIAFGAAEALDELARLGFRVPRGTMA